MTARVVLADDHPLFLRALRTAIEEAGIEVVGTAKRGDELLDLMKEGVEVDAVLLDLSMPGVDGFECIERLRRTHRDVRLIAVSATDEEASIRRALDSGAICFIGKSVNPHDLAAAVRALLSDAVRVGSSEIRQSDTNGEPAGAVARPDGIGVLTKRELEILRLAADGLSNGQMAKKLWVTEQTIKFHLSNVYRKIGVQNRTEASRWAQRNGMLDPID